MLEVKPLEARVLLVTEPWANTASALIVIQFVDCFERVVNVSFADIDDQLLVHGDPTNLLAAINAHPALFSHAKEMLEPATIDTIRVIDVRGSNAFTHIIDAHEADFDAYNNLLKHGAKYVVTYLGARAVNESQPVAAAMIA